MTYIKIDSIFHDINELSDLIDVPRRLIEEVINRGYVSGDETWMDKDLSDALSKMRFASFVSSVNLEIEASQALIDSFNFGEDFEETLNALLLDSMIDEKQYKSLKRWV